MNNYDSLMYLLLNRILINYGMRIKGDGTIVYLFRTTDHAGIRKAHLIHLSDEVEDAFGFLKMDYEDYQSQKFKNIFQFANYFIDNCRYINRGFLSSLEKHASQYVSDTILFRDVMKFIRYIKLAHITVGDFDYLPIITHQNLREAIVRNYFYSEEVSAQFINFKLANLTQVELPGKFSGRQVVQWLPQLQGNPEVTGLLTQAFVNYVTSDYSAVFPRYLIDTDVNVIKKEVISFYYHMFSNVESYKEYLKNLPTETPKVTEDAQLRMDL